MASSTPRIDGAAPDGALQVYAPELYQADRLATPMSGIELSDEVVAEYHRTGYLAIQGVFSPAEVEAAREGLRHLVAGGNPEFDGVYFERFAAERLGELTDDERFDAVRKLAYFVEYDARLKALSHHPKVVDLVSRLLGGQEPTMFQDMALLKPPGGREKPWHQDKAYFDFPVDTPVVGVWVALDEVGPDNGCMFLMEGAHHTGPAIHFMRRDWQICDSDIRQMPWDVVAVPLQPGGCLFFDGLLPHGTPANGTRQRRRACQFHYAPAGVVRTSTDERLAHFGSEGKDVSC